MRGERVSLDRPESGEGHLGHWSGKRRAELCLPLCFPGTHSKGEQGRHPAPQRYPCSLNLAGCQLSPTGASRVSRQNSRVALQIWNMGLLVSFPSSSSVSPEKPETKPCSVLLSSQGTGQSQGPRFWLRVGPLSESSGL